MVVGMAVVAVEGCGSAGGLLGWEYSVVVG